MSTPPERLAGLEAKVAELERARTSIDEKIDGLMSFRNWLLGAAAVLGIVLGFLAEKVKKVLGL